MGRWVFIIINSRKGFTTTNNPDSITTNNPRNNKGFTTTNRSKNQDFIMIKDFTTIRKTVFTTTRTMVSTMTDFTTSRRMDFIMMDFTTTDFTITTSRRRKTDFITKTVSTTTTMSKITKRKTQIKIEEKPTSIN